MKAFTSHKAMLTTEEVALLYGISPSMLNTMHQRNSRREQRHVYQG